MYGGFGSGGPGCNACCGTLQGQMFGYFLLRDDIHRRVLAVKLILSRQPYIILAQIKKSVHDLYYLHAGRGQFRTALSLMATGGVLA